MMDWFDDFASPKCWSLWPRRAFVATFPVSVPLWFVLLCVFMVLFLIVAAATLCAVEGWRWAVKMWKQP